MFRAAFPNAPDQEEKDEVQWVKDTYDLAGNNGSSREPHLTRLAGTWVSPAVALDLGHSYLLGELIQRVVDAEPDPKGNYRRSAKGQKDDSADSPPAAKYPSKSLPTPSPTVIAPNPSKRRKESSPPSTPATVAPKVSQPRRSTRATKSPAPMSRTKPSSSAKPKSQRTTRHDEVLTPGGSDETAIDEESHGIEDVAGPDLFEQDIAEQKELIKGLKAQREAKKSIVDTPKEKPKSKGKAKRIREEEEEPLQFEFKEPEVGERAIATNKRVGMFEEMEPRRKSFAWGVAAFVFGAGAVYVFFLPEFCVLSDKPRHI